MILMMTTLSDFADTESESEDEPSETESDSEDELIIQGMYGSDKVCHLRRSLYGLKQTPRIWYETLWADLISKGFEVSKSCPCVFKMKGKKL
jgi:hypothetical protein